MNLQKELSIELSETANCQRIALSTTSNASAVLSNKVTVSVTLFADVDFAVCQGKTPTALFPVVGTPGHDVIPAGTKIRAEILADNKIAAVSLISGNLYITNEG